MTEVNKMPLIDMQNKLKMILNDHPDAWISPIRAFAWIIRDYYEPSEPISTPLELAELISRLPVYTTYEIFWKMQVNHAPDKLRKEKKEQAYANINIRG